MQILYGMILLITNQIALAVTLPEGFARLKDVDPTIIQEMRYAQNHNFIGNPFKGYEIEECILTKQAAEQLRLNQLQAKRRGLKFKVWDCYRPQKSVDYMYEWSLNGDTKMKQEFYVNEQKSTLFENGYIAKKSGHSRGSTIDLTLVDLVPGQQEDYHEGDLLRPCFSENRFRDNTIDMGTGFDCFDLKAHTYSAEINEIQRMNRKYLLDLMVGFNNYSGEWWHFTLNDEPFKDQYFDFDII